jgi:CBS domain-containing protein
MGRPVRNQSGQEIGTLVDVVARWSDGQTYPPVTGLVVRVGRRLAFVDASAIDRIEHAAVTLRTARLDLRDFARREGEVTLGRDVLDHQLVDVDGVQVIRASDLYLAEVLGRYRLVGVDVSSATLLRRLGPRRGRPAPTPERVIDWAAIQPFGDVRASGMRLRTSHDGLHRLRPGELADLLEDLRRSERQELLDALSPDEAADALEEMQPEDLAQLLRESEPSRAAALVASMEPDEAADALRDLPEDHRSSLLDLMPAERAASLRGLLGYEEDRAGGFMTTTLVTAALHDPLSAVVERLADHDVDIDAVAVVDRDGLLIADLPLLPILLALRATPDAQVAAVVSDDEPVTVGPSASIAEVAEQLVEARRLSLLVVEDGRPIGRILADDVLDALVPGKGRFHFPRLFE